MILFFQIPLTDIRDFVNGYTWKIPVPSWPRPIFLAKNNKQDWFIRQFGKIKPRRKGGLPGWLGEDEICDAKNAIRIQRILSYTSNEQKIHIQGIARHFFFDGHAVGKYELVFAATQGNQLSAQIFSDFINHFLNIEVAPAYNTKLITPLHLAGKNFAKEYLFATTKTKRLNGITGYWINRYNKHWINSGSPVLFIECQEGETEFPIGAEKIIQIKQIPLPSEYNADLFHILHPIDNKFIRVWFL